MDESRVVLLVEDVPLQATSLRTELEQAGWRVVTATDRETAERRFEQSEQMGEAIDAILIDLGLPPGPDEPFVAGIPLIISIRERFPAMPILSYTALTTGHAFHYEEALKELLSRRVSFLYIRQLVGASLPELLHLVWLGYVFISPAPALRLTYAIAEEPDPLDARDWEILRLVSMNYTNPAIAAEIHGLGKDGVRDHLSKIRHKLVDLGWLGPYNTEREDLKHWYQEHAVRFSRTETSTAA